MESRMENATSPLWQKGQSHMQEISVRSVKLRASHQHSSLPRLPERKQISAQGRTSPSPQPVAAPISSLQGARSFPHLSPLKEHSAEKEQNCSITFPHSRRADGPHCGPLPPPVALHAHCMAGTATWLPLALALV